MRKPLVITGGKARSFAVFIVIGIMGALFLSVLWQGASAVNSNINREFTVVIDPGHGGYDPGTVGKGNVYEKDINLSISLKVAELLKPTGVKVILTREEDKDYVTRGASGSKKQSDLNYRINLASEANADIFVSLHLNATVSGRNSGAETFYYFKSDESKLLAESIQQELIKIPGMNRRIAKPGDFYITKLTSMPAVIVELGYLSHSKEGVKLQETWYQEQLARAVAKGIANYFGI